MLLLSCNPLQDLTKKSLFENPSRNKYQRTASKNMTSETQKPLFTADFLYCSSFVIELF